MFVEQIFKAAAPNDPGKKLIPDYADLEDYHFQWIQERLEPTNVQIEAVQFYIRMGAAPHRSEAGEQESKDLLAQKINAYLIESTENINFSLHLVSKY